MTEKGHGRTETRLTSVYALGEPAEVGLFGAWTLLKTERTRTVIKTGKTSSETAWHLCTLDPRSRTARQGAAHIRDHWGIESRDHHRRDCTLLEDKTRSRNANVVGNLAVARAAPLCCSSTPAPKTATWATSPTPAARTELTACACSPRETRSNRNAPGYPC